MSHCSRVHHSTFLLSQLPDHTPLFRPKLVSQQLPLNNVFSFWLYIFAYAFPFPGTPPPSASVCPDFIHPSWHNSFCGSSLGKKRCWNEAVISQAGYERPRTRTWSSGGIWDLGLRVPANLLSTYHLPIGLPTTHPATYIVPTLLPAYSPLLFRIHSLLY